VSLRSAAADLLADLAPVLARWGRWYRFGDLLVAKILAGRPKDLEDASALWRIHGERLDVVRIEGLLQLIEEALGQSDLLPAFRALGTRGS
jgi:hypothetical protein